MSENEGHTVAISRTQADRRKALKDPDSVFQAQFYFDVERGHTVVVQQASSTCTETWTVRDARSDEWLGEVSKGMKRARMDPGGRYVNLEDVPDDVREYRSQRGICPSCMREGATDNPEREMTLFVSPDGSEGWIECDQGRGHRYPPTEVALVAE